MTVINFFITRHGETQWNKIGKFQGQLDSPLTKKGCFQAHAIAALLTDKKFSLIVSSILPRAKKTAETCQTALKCPLSLAPALIERNFGSWQGQYIEQVKSDNNYQAIFHQVNTSAPPNGESGIECATRFQQALKDIACTCQPSNTNTTENHETISNILVVSHGDILRCFLSTMVENYSDEQTINAQNKAFDNGCIFQLSYDIDKQNFTLIETLDITSSSIAPFELTKCSSDITVT